jgi:hypothetical protein
LARKATIWRKPDRVVRVAKAAVVEVAAAAAVEVVAAAARWEWAAAR